MPAPRGLALVLAAAFLIAACSPGPTPTAAPTPTRSPSPPPTASASPSASVQGQLVGACLKQVNQPVGDFTSYMHASLNWDGPPPQKLLLIVEGTNDDQALTLTPNGSVWAGQLGMRQVGPKTISSLIVVYNDGSGADLTAALADLMGGGIFEVREGGTDGFGTCDT